MTTSKEIKEQLIYILSQVAKAKSIEHFEVNPHLDTNYGDGFTGQFYTGSIQDKNTGETVAVAIKKSPFIDYDYNPMYTNENLFYSVIFPALDDLQKEANIKKPFDNIPKYFCGEMESKKEYIALENLKPLGYVMFDKKQFMNKDHLEKIFYTYGKFHALSYVLRNKNLDKYQNISKDLTDIIPEMEIYMDKSLKAAVAAAVNGLDFENDKIILNELEDLEENVMKLFIKGSAYNGKHRCLVHGDCWSNNMLFKYSESGELLDIKLIDFQLCQDNSPIHDLSYFFYSGASKKDFDDLDNYLKIYYHSFSDFAKELGTNLDELFSFETLKQEWKENALYGLLFGVYLWQIKLTPKENFTDVLIPNAEEKQSMEDTMKTWDTLLDKVYKTDLYKERTAPILRHAVEYGILNKNIIEKNK